MLRSPSDEHDELKERLSEQLSSTELKALLDTFEGNTQSVTHYFGTNPTTPNNTTALLTALSHDYEVAVREFLRRRGHEFTPSDIATNKTQDYLVDELGLERKLVERTSDDFSSLLTLIYLCTYDADAGELSAEYEALIALATIFKGNNEKIYYHGSELPLDAVETNLGAYIRNVNRDHDRPKTVRSYGARDAVVVLKVFAETSQTRQAVFQCRRDGADPPLTPTVTHEPKYNVKTIRVKAENVDGRGKITLSKSISGWREDLDTLFEYAFQISGGVEALEQKVLGGASHLLDTAIETAADAETGDTVTERIQQELEVLSEQTLDRLADAGVDAEVLERAEARYNAIEFVGVRIYSDEDTHMAEFVLRSIDEYEDVTNEVDDLDSSITALFAKADPANVRLIFRATDVDGKTQEEFEVGRGRWIAGGRGVPEEAIQMLDDLFETVPPSNE